MNDEMQQSEPPYSNGAEQHVLGSLLLDGDLIDTISTILSPEDFFNSAHAEIYRAMLVQSGSGKKIDSFLIQSEINIELLEAVGGANYLGVLYDTVPTTVGITNYADVIREKSILRNVAKTGIFMAEQSRVKGMKSAEILSQAEQALYQLTETKDKSKGFISTQAAMPGVLSDIESTQKGGIVKGSVKTGFGLIDHMIGSLLPGNLYIIAGRPSMGKTSFAMNIVANAALKNGDSCGVFSLEMTTNQLITRMIGSEAGIPVDKLFNGQVSESDQYKINPMAEKIANAPILIDDSGGLKITDIRSRARRLKREHDIKLIVIDYLGLILGSKNSESKVHEVTEVVQGLKAMSKELNIPVIAIAQLNRGVEIRTPPIPRKSDLRDSGSIEQEADVIMLMYRPEVYFPNKPELQGVADVIIDKNRNGSTGTAGLEFVGQFTRFQNRPY
jgi:replicative DNA helicase